jgi:hypothetical protein
MRTTGTPTARFRAARQVAALAAAVLLAATVTACSPDPTRPLCAVGIDLSASTAVPSVRDNYLAALGRVLDYCIAGQGRLYVDAITGNSRANSIVPLQADLHVKNDNDLYRKAEIAKLRRDKLAEVRKWMEASANDRTVREGGTDVLGGVVNLAGAGGSGTPAGSRNITLLTDGLHNRVINVTSPAVDQRRITQMLSLAKSNGMVPALGGARVHMAGVGAGTDAARLDPSRWGGIQQWWNAYFAAADGQLVGYGKDLGSFP